MTDFNAWQTSHIDLRWRPPTADAWPVATLDGNRKVPEPSPRQ
jgi:hypothetical protein